MSCKHQELDNPTMIDMDAYLATGEVRALKNDFVEPEEEEIRYIGDIPEDERDEYFDKYVF